jgi:hypothetical protein
VSNISGAGKRDTDDENQMLFAPEFRIAAPAHPAREFVAEKAASSELIW